MSELAIIAPDDLRALVTEAVTSALASVELPAGGDDELVIHPRRFYKRSEAAGLLGLPNAKAMSRIPEAELTRCHVGAGRGSVRYLGADLIAYAKGLPMPDTQAMVDGARDELVRRLSVPTPVRPAKGNKRTRVL